MIVAHPDDETLGAGGTIARLSVQNCPVHCLSLTNGTGARNCEPLAGKDRLAAFNDASSLLGVRSTATLEYEDQRLDHYPFLDLVQAVECWAAKFEPIAVLTHSSSDLNLDHRIVCEVVATAFRPYKFSCLSLIASFEINSTTELGTLIGRSFRPTMFVDIQESLPLKLKAMQRYESEIGSFPHPRSSDALVAAARHRGITMASQAAEAFEVLFLAGRKAEALEALFAR